MKIHLLSFALAATAALALPVNAMADNASDQVHRQFYGYFLNNDDFPRMTWGVASQYFDTPSQSELEYNYAEIDGSMYGVYAGVGVEGIMYMCEYLFSSALAQPENGNLVAYNTFSGERKIIGPWSIENTAFKPSDMTYDANSGTIYAIGYDYGSGLYELDPATATFTKLVDLAGGVTLAASPAGDLYTIALDGFLYRINKTTGSMIRIFDTGMTGMMNMQTMEFDRTNGKLYWASNCSSNDPLNVQLQEIDLSDAANITITQVGPIGNNAVFLSMYIPSASSFEAPAAPADITAATADPEILNATISWTNPTTDFAGNTISALNGVVLFRDGKQIKLFTGITPGQQMSYDDNEVPAIGEYRYDVMAFNSKGDGMKGTVFAYVGKDAPGAPEGVSLKVADDFRSATLTWVAPSFGKHDGVFDRSEVRYNIIRRPDNLKVATGLTETTYTDARFNRLLCYWYDIEAYNEIGSSTATTQQKIIGPALATPVDEYFEELAEVANHWMVIDSNNDGNTWIFDTTVSHDIFGDYECAAQYILTPTSIDSRLSDADDWLISAPIAFEADKEYELVVHGRSLAATPQQVDLCFGKTADISAMNKIGEAQVDLLAFDPEVETAPLEAFSADIPAGSTLGCVGLHLVAPIPEQYMCFLQIGRVEVKEKAPSAVSDIAAETISISVVNGLLTIDGNFSNAALYSIDGRLIGNIAAATTDLTHLAHGIYIVTVDGVSHKFAI